MSVVLYHNAPRIGNLIVTLSQHNDFSFPLMTVTINPRDHVILKKDHIEHPKDQKYPGTWINEDDSWDFEKFKKEFHWKIVQLKEFEIEFDMVGVSPSLSNALRRIMIAEVPLMAIETVYVNQNTSVLNDELMAQRIGLIPLFANPDSFEKFDGEPTDLNTLVFKCTKMCSYKEGMPKEGITDEEMLYDNYKVMSEDLEWVPEGVQKNWMDDIKVQPGIPIVYLRPNQSVEIECHAIKGIGSDHTKFSPVCTASYRLLPTIEIKKPIVDKDAIKFQKCFTTGVISIENNKAIVQDARISTVSRECLRHDEFVHKVVLGKKKDHFIFNVESTGSLTSSTIVKKGLQVLKSKLEAIQSDLRETDFYLQEQ